MKVVITHRALYLYDNVAKLLPYVEQAYNLTDLVINEYESRSVHRSSTEMIIQLLVVVAIRCYLLLFFSFHDLSNFLRERHDFALAISVPFSFPPLPPNHLLLGD